MSLSTGGIRFQDPTLGNASPWIYVWNMWSLTASTGFIGLRLWSRRAQLGLDDLLNSISFAVSVTSNATIFAALSQGLGNPKGITDEGKCSSVASIVVTSICLLFVTDFLSKCSTLLLTRRVISHGASPDKMQRCACDILLATCLAWVIIALALLGSDCTTHCSLDTGGVCPSGNRVHAIIAISIFLEVAIFALPCWLFFNLQMTFTLKLTTLGLFAIRLPLIAFSSVYMGNFSHYIQSVDAGSPNIGPGIYWQLVLLACVVVAPSLQALKKSAELFNTHGAQVGNSNKGSGYRVQDLSSANSQSRTRKLSRQLSRTLSRRLVIEPSESKAELRPDEPRHETHIQHDDASRQESWTTGSGKGSVKHSMKNSPPRLIIRQQTDWDVTIQG